MRFMFCTAWPAAPLTRLSMALTTTARLVRASKVTPISQKLVRATARRSGTWPRVVQADEGLGGVLPLVDGEQVFGAGDVGGPEVDGLEDAAIERQELRGEAELVLFEAGDLEHFGDVAVVEDGVRREVFGDFAEAGLEAGLASRAADAGFGVADDAGGAIDHAGFDQRAEGEIGGGGVAAGVGDEARGGDAGRGKTRAGRRRPRPAVPAGCASPYTRLYSFRACAGGRRR